MVVLSRRREETAWDCLYAHRCLVKIACASSWSLFNDTCRPHHLYEWRVPWRVITKEYRTAIVDRRRRRIWYTLTNYKKYRRIYTAHTIVTKSIAKILKTHPSHHKKIQICISFLDDKSGIFHSTHSLGSLKKLQTWTYLLMERYAYMGTTYGKSCIVVSRGRNPINVIFTFF